jgi:uncharacterized protein (DUF58 family)
LSLPPELQKKIKLLELAARKRVDNIFLGQYSSAFRGQGITFSEFREYVPGDDVRAISWPLTARAGKPFVKVFDEEREMTIMLAVDVSGSSDYGSREFFKGEVIHHLAALLGFAASRNNDLVGLCLFSDQVEHYVPPKKGRGHLQRILRDLYFFRPRSRRTRVAEACEHLQGALKKRAHVFLFSDFFDSDFEKPLRMMANKHDAVAVIVTDPTESQLPDWGLVDLEDAETGEVMTVDASAPWFRRDYQAHVTRRFMERDQALRRAQVDRIDVAVGRDFVEPLIEFFRRRNRR